MFTTKDKYENTGKIGMEYKNDLQIYVCNLVQAVIKSSKKILKQKSLL